MGGVDRGGIVSDLERIGRRARILDFHPAELGRGGVHARHVQEHRLEPGVRRGDPLAIGGGAADRLRGRGLGNRRDHAG